MSVMYWTAKNGWSRRSFLKASAATGLGLVASPLIVENAFSSSGELNFMGWAGYDFKKFFEGFTASTGIKMNFIEQPDNESIFAQTKLALQTGAVDCFEPTIDRVGSYATDGIVQPWDESKIKLDGFLQDLVTGANGETAKVDGKRYFLPSVWGTEALVYNTQENPLVYGTASLGDLFDPKFEGKVTVRPHSALAAMGRYLDSLGGKLPHPFMESYTDETKMKANWDVILAEAIKSKKNIVQFWKGENEAQAAFLTNGCTLGHCWDSTGFNLQKAGQPISYLAPKEGAFAWLQGYMLHKNAKNVEQAHAFANYVGSADGGALNATAFAANPTANGALEKMDPAVTAFYKAAYPGDALSKLWWWPVQASWYLKLRNEYADKFQAA